MPKPTDDGKTYTFKIRDGVKFHDGSPLTAADVAASWHEIIHPPPGRLECARRTTTSMVDSVEAPDADHRGVPAEIRHQRLPAGARRSLRLHLQEGDPRQGSALVRKERHGLGPVQVRRLRDRPVDQGRAQSRLLSQGTAVSRRLHRHLRRQAGGAGRRHPRRPRGDGVPRSAAVARSTISSASSATRSPCRPATGTAAT